MILKASNFKQLLTTKGRHRDTGGEVKGLMLVVVNKNNASWQLRYQRDGKEHWLGLGSARLLKLKDARAKARAIRLQLLNGQDPLDAKRQTKFAAQQALSFEEAAKAYFEHHERKWTNRKHADQFLSSLRDYAFPVIGSLPLDRIDTALVLKVLERPLPDGDGKFWDARPTTARRVRGRIENVLDWATVRGYRAGENPARWAGHLREALPAHTERGKKHLAALPYSEVAAFVSALSNRADIASRALTFTILTAARTGETIGATWSEFDLDAGVWTIPADRMKGGKIHRVPLAQEAVSLLRSLPQEANNPSVFIGPRPGGALSITAMKELLAKLRRLGECSDITVHGFRSTFMDWAHETTGYPKVVIDMALAHTVGDKVEAAYRRGDLFEKRRRLMAEWGRFCAAQPAVAGGVVHQLLKGQR